jgi:hypothetical protein
MMQPTLKPSAAIYPPPVQAAPTFTAGAYPPPRDEQTPNAIINEPPQDPNNLKITPTVPPIAADGWYIFSDPEVGYSFHYPPGSHLSAGKGPRYPFTAIELEVRVPDEVSYHGLSISVQPNPAALSPAEFAVRTYSQLAPGINPPPDFARNAGSVRVGKATALKVVIPPTLSEFTLFLPYKDKMLIIAPVRNQTVLDDPVKTRAGEIFENILETFVFDP